MPGPGTWSPGDVLTADDLNAIGTWVSYTPTLTQNVARTCTVNYAEYMLINKICVVNVDLTCTTTGSNNTISVSLPFGVAGSTRQVLGSGIFYDDSATDVVLVNVLKPAGSPTTSVQFVSDATTVLTTPINTTLGNNDVISFSITYQTV